MDKPSYIVIEDDKITFHDAADLWGLTSHQAEKKLIEEYGTEYSCLSIGPAGENLNYISCINSDYYRQAGRGGIGAVMGSKKLKASAPTRLATDLQMPLTSAGISAPLESWECTTRRT